MLYYIIFLYFITGISFGIAFAISTAVDYLVDKTVWYYYLPISHYYKDKVLGPLNFVITWEDINFFGKLFPFILLLPMYPFYFIAYNITFLISLFPILYKWVFRVRKK